jgi:nicotinate phosphoribosyltransferase
VGPRLRDSQVFAFKCGRASTAATWGIALSDVCGMDAFLRDFDLFFCKLFDGGAATIRATRSSGARS